MFEITFRLTLCTVFVFLSSADYLSLDGNDWTAVNQNQSIL